MTELTKLLLSSGSITEDDLFDQHLPLVYQSVSSVHWTPVKVIKQIAEFLKDDDENTKFVDIGSGCGKLCAVLSLLTKFNIYGIEQRPELHKVAEKMKMSNNLTRVHYMCGNMLEMDWSLFDVYYLYNPFQEHISALPNMRINQKIPFDKKYYIMYTDEVFRQLCRVEIGKRLITFHGYGGPIPDSWELVQSQVIGYGDLTVWEKVR